MYEPFKNAILDLLKAPKEPPPTPRGSHASIQIFRASPQFLQYQFLWVTVALVVLAAVFLIISVAVFSNDPALGVIVFVALVLLWGLITTMAYILVRIEYDLRYYIVTDRSLRIRVGVWSILEQTLTYANVQNIKVEQGPVERLFGIATLSVETAGGGGSVAQPGENQFGVKNYHRAVLSGLENAEEIRNLMLGYLRRYTHVSGLGDPDEGKRLGKGLGKKELDALREILQEAKSLRQTLSM